MSTLKEAREAITEVLEEAGIKAYAHFPERFVPPAATIQGAEPYLSSEGQTFGHFQLNHEVTVAAKNGSYGQMTDDLDALLWTAVNALLAAGYGIENVRQPHVLEVSGATFPASTITINSLIPN